MLFGTHISASGGVDKAPQNAATANCEVFQFFSRSPQGGPAPVLTAETIKKFKANCRKFKQAESYIHAPYYINLASAKNNIYYGSISVLREELERGSQLSVKYMMTHLGSAKDLGKTTASKKVIEGLQKVLENYTGSTQFLIEMSAGAGEIMGDTFEEIAEIIVKVGGEIGVCFDTAHAFESGYDLRDQIAVKKTFDKFDKIIGLKKLKLIHANDSKTALGSHMDRHEHLGAGQIGLAGFCAIINEPRLQKVNLILETPTVAGALRDIKWLKETRDNKIAKDKK